MFFLWRLLGQRSVSGEAGNSLIRRKKGATVNIVNRNPRNTETELVLLGEDDLEDLVGHRGNTDFCPGHIVSSNFLVTGKGNGAAAMTENQLQKSWLLLRRQN